MWSHVLLPCLALAAALQYGCFAASETGFCARSPLLLLNENSFCRSDPDPDAWVREIGTERLASPATGSSAAFNQSGWDGPRHCVREYCVYSSRQFSGGITVITDSRNAKRIAELPEASISRTGSPSFHVTEVPGKGIGLVANRTIRRGEPIMTMQPTFMIHRKMTDDLLPEEQHRILDAALLKLPADRRRAFSRQLGQFGGHRVSDILLTNAFQMDVGGEGEGEGEREGGHHLGDFPDVARFNHDCRPNVAFRIDSQLAHHTHAVRDITAGEELTLAYVNPFEAHAVRQQHTRQSWGFKCTCKHCSMPEEEIRESDARLYEIDEVEAELGDFTSNKASVDMVWRLLELYEAEGLDAKVHGAYVLAALNFNLFGYSRDAVKYAELAFETGVVEFGPDAGDVKAMQELASNPKGHFTWRRRVSAY